MRASNARCQYYIDSLILLKIRTDFMEYKRCEYCHLRDFNLIDYKNARERFRPDVVSVLFVAESPANLNKKHEYPYFYFIGQRPAASSLYMNTMRAVFGDDLDYTDDKERHLKAFCAKGYFLLDAAKCPVDKMNLAEEARNSIILSCARTNLLTDIRELRPESILLIKKNVFEVLYTTLRNEGFEVLNDSPIPFPGTGHQAEYRVKVRNYLTAQNHQR